MVQGGRALTRHGRDPAPRIAAQEREGLGFDSQPRDLAESTGRNRAQFLAVGFPVAVAHDATGVEHVAALKPEYFEGTSEDAQILELFWRVNEHFHPS